MKLRIFHKITIALLIVFVFVSIVFTGINQTFQTRRIETVQDKIILLLNTLVERDSQLLANEIFEKRIRAITIRLEEMKKVHGIQLISVYDDNGELIYSTENGFPKKRLSHEAYPHIDNTTYQKESVLIYVDGIYAIGERLGYILIYYSLSDIESERITSLTLILLQLATILLGLFFILQIILSKVVISKLNIFREGFERIEKGESGAQISIKGNDELGEMAQAFNKMTSERARVNEEINHLRNYLNNIINSMPSVLVGVDTDGDITQWNQRAIDVTGKSSEDAIGNNLKMIYPDLAIDIEQVYLAIKERQVKQLSKVLKHNDGEDTFDDITIFPLIANGVEGAVIRVDDVTERYRMEETMIQSEKMLSVGGLAAGMAHEINNPLAGMIQTAEVMAKRLDNGKSIPANVTAAEKAGVTIDSISEYMKLRGIPRMVTTICESGKRVSNIVENMLSFSRKTEGKFNSFSIPDLIDKTLLLASTDYDLKKHFDFKEINIIRKFEEELPLIDCEKAKIQQVLLNIFRNGAQIMQETNTENPQFIIELNYEKINKMIRIAISDNGPGMSEDIRKRVFEPFFTTKIEGKGTGLGLSVSYFIITENHNGEMSVESTPEDGACFIIKLPITCY